MLKKWVMYEGGIIPFFFVFHSSVLIGLIHDVYIFSESFFKFHIQ